MGVLEEKNWKSARRSQVVKLYSQDKERVAGTQVNFQVINDNNV